MPTCFVIQPFDGGKYDKRFEDIYSPAIRAANLEPYRVDKDVGVDVPIDAIEQGIRKAAVCLADITTDNPNVWYELGFAFAAGRPMVMVCSDERKGKYPFDIQHRTIIPYLADSPRDFQALQSNITERIKSLISRTNALQVIQDSEQVAPVHGLTQPELAVLAAVGGSVVLSEEGVSAYSVRQEVERAGFNPLGFSIGIRRLSAKGFIVLQSAPDYYDSSETYREIVITVDGWNWIEQNEDKFMLRRPGSDSPTSKNDIPF